MPVSEGDSWFQFPFLIDDVIDHLGNDFLIWEFDAAGDTADNMVNRQPEYSRSRRAESHQGRGLPVLGRRQRCHRRGPFGNPVLSGLLKPFKAGKDAAWHVDKGALAAVLSRLEADYRKVIAIPAAILTSSACRSSSTDTIMPSPAAIPDTRHPIYAKQDEWLGGPMAEKGIVDLTLQRAIIHLLIDALYEMLERVAGRSAVTRVFVVDVRGTLRQGDWADEIHGTSSGFKRVSDLFGAAIKRAI